MLSPLGRQSAESILADWTDRIAKGEVPPAPPRPAGVERNIVLTMWDMGTPTTFAHDMYETDKRHPESNPYGPVYLGDFNSGDVHVLDPKRNADQTVHLVLRDGPDSLHAGSHVTANVAYPSLFWGDEQIYDEKEQTEVKNVDTKGRLWMGTIFRAPANNPVWCKEGSSNKFAQYFPLNVAGRQAAFYHG